MFPKVKCSCDIFREVVDPEDPGNRKLTKREHDLFASDMIKMEFKITYENLVPDEEEGYICSRNYPYLKKHAWHLILCDAKTKERVFMMDNKRRSDALNETDDAKKNPDFIPYDGNVYF